MKLVGFRNWWWGGGKMSFEQVHLKSVGKGMKQFRIWSRKIITFLEKGLGGWGFW